MHLLQYFDKLSLKPENAKELKGLILDLAIRGRLTEDWRKINPDVETATDILERIKEDKKRLITEKKIKKEKPFPNISNEDIPYEIPDNWVWCRLIDICSYIQRGKSPKYSEVSKIPVISQKCVQWDDFYIERAKFIIPETLEKYVEIRYLQYNDLLWNSTGDGTVGRTILFPKTDYDIVVADSHVTVVRTFKQSVKPMYLWIFTACSDTQRTVLGKVSGSTKQTELGTGTVKSLLFPLPPFKEQKAIVKIVNQLMEEVDQLETQTKTRVQLRHDFIKSSLRQLTTADSQAEWKKLQPQFTSFFDTVESIDKLKEAILQLAVQGKLTKQWRENNPNVEPASLLLEKIKEEKAKLIKEKKIRKEKPLPEIGKEEIPFELPEGWVWCRWIDLLHHSKYSMKRGPFGSSLRKADFVQSGIRVFEQYNPINDDPHWMRYFITSEKYESMKAFTAGAGDFLISCSGATLGRIVYLPSDTEEGIINQALLKLRLNDKMIAAKYFLRLFRSQYIQEKVWQKAKGMAQPNMAGVKELKNIVIPLPPINEQETIIHSTNQLWESCDQMKSEIENRNTLSKDFLRSSIREIMEKTQSLT